MGIPSGTQLTFHFWRDQGGRLRVTLKELGVTRPVETADGSRRYKILKVLPINLYGRISEEDFWRLQLAQDGDTVQVVIK